MKGRLAKYIPLSLKLYLRKVIIILLGRKKVLITKSNKNFNGKNNNIYQEQLSELKDVDYIISGNDNEIHFGRECYIEGVTFRIKGDNNKIYIGEKCIFDRIQPYGFNKNESGLAFNIKGNDHLIEINEKCRFNRGGIVWFADQKGHLIIGQDSTFEEVKIYITEPGSKVEIGTDCMFADGITIRTGDSHSVIDSTSGLRLNPAKNIKIENHVWVASQTILLKGTIIRENSIVATGSVLTKPYYKEGIIIAGNPGRIIKEGISWTRERITA